MAELHESPPDACNKGGSVPAFREGDGLAAASSAKGYTEQPLGAMPVHTFCLRMDHAGDGIDGNGQYIWFVAEPVG